MPTKCPKFYSDEKMKERQRDADERKHDSESEICQRPM